MKGLLKNNLYTTLANAKIFSAAMALFGVIVIVIDNRLPALIISYTSAVMIGFTFISLESMYKENSSKWPKYKMTAPVRRNDIVQSFFISQLIWLAVGISFAGIIVILSVALHGYPFDRNTDVFMLFVVGAGISLFMTAIFLPLFFLGSEEQNEAFLIISFFAGGGIFVGLTALINILFAPADTLRLILSGIAILACAASFFSLSYPLTVRIFRRKEC